MGSELERPVVHEGVVNGQSAAAEGTGASGESSSVPAAEAAAGPISKVDALTGRVRRLLREDGWWWNFSHQGVAGLLSGLVTGLIVGFVLFVSQNKAEDQRSEDLAQISRNEAGRQLVAANATLRGADLSFLDLRGLYAPNESFSLSTFRATNLAGAVLADADLTDVSLFQANLVGAKLSGTSLNDDWRHFDGRDNWGGVTSVCYDATTVWPEGFEPPPADCTGWDGPLDPEEGWVADRFELSTEWLPDAAATQDDLYIRERGP